MTKKALCVGINYAGTDHALRGCINDADDWADLLNEQGFDVATIAEKEATKATILDCISHLIGVLKPGDVGAITYSGHGTWIPSEDGDEPDGRYEAICPIDMGDDGHNLIIGPEFKKEFDKIRPGAHVLFLTDSCFSGTVYRFLNGFGEMQRKVRFIPPAHFLKSIDKVYRMTLGFGQTQNTKSKLPLPGLVHMSGCGDNEFSNDAHIDGRFNGAMTYYAIRAFRQVLTAKGTYQDAWAMVRQALPSWEFTQSPMLNAEPALKQTQLLA
jgi:metacaspase-1